MGRAFCRFSKEDSMSKNKSHFANPRYLRNSPALYAPKGKAISMKKVFIIMVGMAAAFALVTM